MSARKFVVGAALVASGLAGGSVAASSYPPDAPPENTVLTSSGASDPAPAVAQPTAAQLPETGSDAGTMVMIAGGAVAAGAALIAVARRRRHPALAG